MRVIEFRGDGIEAMIATRKLIRTVRFVLAGAVVMYAFMVLPAEAILQSQPQDAKALARLRQGYLVTYALCLSIALYGLVLHFVGFSISQIAPFFVAGLALIVFLGPKVTGQSEFPPQSGPITPS
jgi:hypothetical protein